MAPKKAATTKKGAASTSNHPPYGDMIKEAIINLKDRMGSSRQAIKKYVQANNNLGGVTDAQFTTQFNRALAKGSETGVFARPKGPSGPVKLAGPSKTTTTTTTKTTKAPAKAKGTKTVPKKTSAMATTKKTTTKKAPAKKADTKSKATKTKKTPAMAPAVENKPATVLTKTKTGRVVKSTAPPDAKKAVTKKKVPAKKAAPKKSTTPKKA